MRINFTLPSSKLTGGNRVLVEVATRLARRGHNVSIVSLGLPELTWVASEPNVKWIFPEEKRTIALPKIGRITLNRLYQWYLEPRFTYSLDSSRLMVNATPSDVDINVATHWTTASAVHRSGIGVPAYYMQHYEAIFSDDPYTSRAADETYALPMHRVANSSWLKNLLQRRFAASSEGPVIPGIDTGIFYPRDVKEARREGKIVLALGKSNRLKGISTLFDALKIAARQVPDLKLWLYGSESDLQQYSPIPCKYFAYPSDDELARLYSSTDIVVIPSLFESSPLPPLEAMACGAAVVTTRIGTEDYCFHERNSLVVKPGNAADLAAAIVKLLSDDTLATNLRKMGHQTARDFTWDKAVMLVEDIFKRMMQSA